MISVLLVGKKQLGACPGSLPSLGAAARALQNGGLTANLILHASLVLPARS